MYLISVIVPCFNAERWIGEALKSVLEQEIKDIEIIVIDDGSTDSSVDIIKKDFTSVHVIESEHRGASVARNIGTRESKGEFIQYLDVDDMIAPGKLKAQMRGLQKTGADIAYSDWQKLINNDCGLFKKGEIIKRKLRNPEIDLFTDFWCPPATYLFRKSIVEKIGGWNENLPVIQDARFALDCALHSGKFIYCPGVMAYYRIQQSNSVSTRDSTAFVKDCLENASGIEKWWQDNGGINEERKKALLKVYGYAARASFENDKKMFDEAFSALERLSPGYIPEGPYHLRAASRLFGYKNAEKIASLYRRTLKSKII